jgi:hypothetical protein
LAFTIYRSQAPELQVENHDPPTRAPQRRMALKCSLSSIEWKPQYAEALNNLVIKVNQLTIHTYMLSRFLFVRELSDDPNFNLQEYVTKDFFVEVFLSLTTRDRNDERCSTQTLYYRRFIDTGINYYFMISGYRRIELQAAQQIALFQANTVVTAYLNSIMNGFGQQLRRVVNSLLGVKDRASQRRAELRQQGRTAAFISSRLEEEVYAPARQFKLAIAQRRSNISTIPTTMQNAFLALEPAIKAYPDNYEFGRNSIYFDAKAHPEYHILAYYRLSQVCEKFGIKSFQSLPLRNSFVPGYLQIDTTVLRKNILHERSNDYSLEGKMRSWRKVVNLNAKAFKTQASDHELKFRGSIQTDGVGVSVLKTNFDTRAGGPRRQSLQIKIREPNVADLSQEELHAAEGRCVLVDPNRRDIMYCMHEASTPDVPQIMRYTKNTQAKLRKERKYRGIRQSVKDDNRAIAEAEAKLSLFPRCTTSTVVYTRFIIQRSKVAALLFHHYSDTTGLLAQNVNANPLHRKLKLSSIINRNREDDRLVKDLRQSFGENCILVMGNWSAGNIAFHEPIRGIGMRRALRKRGITLLMIDEYMTSKHCPHCFQRSLETFLRVPNPRPWRREEQPTVVCNGLLRCNNQNCMQPRQTTRLWNRDMAAVCNFRHILQGLRLDGSRPLRFRRRHPQNNPR